MACELEPIARASQVGSWPGSEKVSEEAGLGVGLREEPAAGHTRKEVDLSVITDVPLCLT